jgi:hypothetical protein
MASLRRFLARGFRNSDAHQCLFRPIGSKSPEPFAGKAAARGEAQAREHQAAIGSRRRKGSRKGVAVTELPTASAGWVSIKAGLISSLKR